VSVDLLHLYAQMLLMRRFDEKVGDLFRRAKLPGFVHLYIGEEAIAAGVCDVLRRDDFLTSTHRGHGHFIAKGGDVRACMAELYGKASGCCHGKGGSLHVADASVGMLGANGIVAAALPIAVGVAYGAARLRGTDQVVAAFLGDGATGEGAFHEACNMASAWKLPVVFVCENNYYGVGTRLRAVSASENLAQRAAAYGMHAEALDGNDVLAVRAAAGMVGGGGGAAAAGGVGRARSGAGPSFLECRTWRHRAHVEGEQPKYWDEQERAAWLARDPLPRFADHITSGGFATAEDLEAMAREAAELVEDAVQLAESEPFPSETDALGDVFGPPLDQAGAAR
jgi:pyruvate dehydrogenase E1 component alpha subunit